MLLGSLFDHHSPKHLAIPLGIPGSLFPSTKGTPRSDAAVYHKKEINWGSEFQNAPTYPKDTPSQSLKGQNHRKKYTASYWVTQLLLSHAGQAGEWEDQNGKEFISNHHSPLGQKMPGGIQG